VSALGFPGPLEVVVLYPDTCACLLCLLLDGPLGSLRSGERDAQADELVIGVGCIEDLAQFLEKLPDLVASLWSGDAAVGQFDDVPLEGGRLRGGTSGAGLVGLSRRVPVFLVVVGEQLVVLYVADRLAWLTVPRRRPPAGGRRRA
jgi:hypothetical protein